MTLVYRRERADMPAFAEEVEAAEREGLRIVERAEPVALQTDDSGRLTGVTLRDTVLDGVGADGRSASAARPAPSTPSARSAASSRSGKNRLTRAGRRPSGWTNWLPTRAAASRPASTLRATS